MILVTTGLSRRMCFFNHVLWVYKMLNVREISVYQSKLIDILIDKLLFYVSVAPGIGAARIFQSPKRGVHRFDRVASCEWLLKKPSNFEDNVIWND